MFKNIYKVIETYTKLGQVRLTVLWLFNVILTLTGNANSLIQIEKGTTWRKSIAMEKHHLKSPNKSQPDRHWRQRNLLVSSVWFNETSWIGLLRGNIKQSILPRLTSKKVR